MSDDPPPEEPIPPETIEGGPEEEPLIAFEEEAATPDAETDEEPRLLGMSERAITATITAAALFIVVLAVYITAMLLSDQGRPVPRQSEPTNPVYPSFVPLSITFFGPETGLVSGFVPCAGCEGGRSGLIARTNDGGATWTVVRKADRPVVDVSRVGSEGEIWAGTSACSSQAFIGCDIGYLRSTDAGSTWRSASAPRTGALASPPPQPGPCRWDHPYPVSSSFPTHRRGWVFCSLRPTGMVQQFKGLYTTEDAGRQWRELPEFRPQRDGGVANPGNMPVDGFPAGVSFLSSGTGWMWTHGDRSSLSVSSNGGMRWSRLWHSPEGGDIRIVSASLVDRDWGWVLRRTPTGSELSRLVTGQGQLAWEPATTWPPLPPDAS